ELLGNWYGQSLKQSGYAAAFDVVIPVPLHKSKLRKRGYNQSEYYAKGLANALDIELNSSCIKRTSNSSTQTSKNRLERWENVDKIFTVTDATAVKGKRVLLVDDVITTGATLEACATALIEAGCAEISIGAIAAA
ncbi:MAG: ComF family protein, partial [Hymenobacteraceae bacterium]|nr:ComF family protein [Hymenobacteraceae bacterium]MDX5397107.1 ComF family protein [Hymenobacteraceae bacterium]MDX5442413.1 ComF family protein [Hymenobacteraceae bacterium]MDX5513185.1 ComF family protein [Hymenobacteraceae bacterium]